MKCKYPVVLGKGRAFPCGQCLPCRVNRRRIWTHRIMLEARQYSDNCFLTLTYDDEHLPEGATLVPKDLQDFLKRLRKAISPLKLRYFGCGEYGNETQRPHYHLCLFGYPTCVWGMSRYRAGRVSCCARCDAVRAAWGQGNVLLGTLEDRSAQYVCGYVSKKMTGKDDERLNGRHPEFARMSLKPGIGGDALHEVASELMRFGLEEKELDVPGGLRHGARILPLGRYLRRRLRVLVGKSPDVPPEVMEALAAEVSHLWEAAEAATPGEGELRRYVFADYVAQECAGEVARVEALERIHRKRGSV